MTSQDQERMESLLKMMYSHLCLKVNKVQVHHHQYSIHQLNNRHHHNQCNKPSKVCSHYSYKRFEPKFLELPTRNIVSSGGSRREPLGPIAKAMTKSMNEANKIPHFGYKGNS